MFPKIFAAEIVFMIVLNAAEGGATERLCVTEVEFQRASKLLADATAKYDRGHFESAATLAAQGNEALPSLVFKDRLDDTGEKLSVADLDEKNREFAHAAAIRMRILEERLNGYRSLVLKDCK